jgi:hypothetical protein
MRRTIPVALAILALATGFCGRNAFAQSLGQEYSRPALTPCAASISHLEVAQQGCCSYHQGVCGCDNGRTACCDGTDSPSCECHSPNAATIPPQLPLVLADEWVNPYVKSDGTYVNGYWRSDPDGNPYNNYSFPGNVNPYTGKVAPGNPDTYLKNYYDRSGGSYGSSDTTTDDDAGDSLDEGDGGGDD